ncbi:MAG: trehalose-phosphatase [Candidatus Eisenbacteria bacterium]
MRTTIAHDRPEGTVTRRSRPHALPRELVTALARLARMPRLLVASDLDGTLAPLAPRPELARVPARARRALRRLADARGVRVGVVSGRALADVARRIRIPRLWLAGSAGLETRAPDRVIRAHVSRRRALPRSLRDTFRAWCARFPGSWLEVKPHTLALHHRDVAAARRAAFVAGVRRRVAPHRGRLRLIRGRRVVELVPEVGRDKSSVLAAWSRDLPRRAVLWLGDDAHDEPAHAWVTRRRGIAVKVGGGRSAARFRLRSPEQVIETLERLEALRVAAGSRPVVSAAARAAARRGRAARRPRPSRRG